MWNASLFPTGVDRKVVLKRTALGVLALAALSLAACQEQPGGDNNICNVKISLNAPDTSSRYERFSQLANIITHLTTNAISDEHAVVYTILGFDELARSSTYVPISCRRAWRSLQSLANRQNTHQAETIRTVTIENADITLMDITEPDFPGATEAFAIGWSGAAPGECLARAQATVSVSKDMSEYEIMSRGHDILSSIVEISPSLGVPIADYSVIDAVLDAELDANCRNRQEAVEFLGRYWIESNRDLLERFSITSTDLVVTTDDITLEYLEILRNGDGN